MSSFLRTGSAFVLSLLAALAISACAGEAVVVRQHVTIRSAPPGARVSLRARRLEWYERDHPWQSGKPGSVMEARRSARVLPAGHWQLIGQTPLERYPLAVAVKHDGAVHEIFKEVRVRVVAAGYEPFEAPLALVGTDASRGIELDVRLEPQAQLSFPNVSQTLVIETVPPGAVVALEVKQRGTGNYRFERLLEGRAHVIGTAPVMGYQLVTTRRVTRNGKADGQYRLYSDVRVVASLPGYEPKEQSLAVYGATEETVLRVKLILEPRPK